MAWKRARTILVQSAKSWSEHSAPRLAASLSFYAILSLAPLLVIAVTIATKFMDSVTIRSSLREETSQALGKGASDLLLSIVDHASTPTSSIPATIIAVAIALYAASGLFNQLQESIEDIWEIRHEGHPIRLFLKGRLISVVMLLSFLLIFMAWLVLDSVLGWLARTSGGFMGWPIISLLASSLFATAVFGLTFKTLPHGRVLWKDVWLGALAAGLGFSIAKFLLSLYFTFSGVAAAYGSAGALVVVLLWIYYSAQIFFYGAEVTRFLALRRVSRVAATLGSPIEPSTGSQGSR